MSDVCKACKSKMQLQGVMACMYRMHPSLQVMLAIGSHVCLTLQRLEQQVKQV